MRWTVWLLGVCGVMAWSGTEAPGQQSPGSPSPLATTASLRRIVPKGKGRLGVVGDQGTWIHLRGSEPGKLQTFAQPWTLQGGFFLNTKQGWLCATEALPALPLTRGVLLRTEDGGRSWKRIGGLLPGLKDLCFWDGKQGVAVCEPSPLVPSGVLKTSDAGRSWHPVPGPPERWTRVLRLAQGKALLLGPNATAVLEKGRRIRPLPHPWSNQSFLTWAVDERGRLWAAGTGGLVAFSSDLGRSWRPVDLGPGAQAMDILSIATWKQKIWLAGAPGGIGFFSPDGGHSWERFTLPSPLPVYDLKFVDARRGWAVGPLGHVWNTSDGGRSWRTVHSGAQRAAVWCVWLDADTIPWEVLAWLAHQEGYIVVVSLLGDRTSWGRSWDRQFRLRTRQALLRLGVAEVVFSSRFPLPQPDLAPDQETLLRYWRAVQGQDPNQSVQRWLVSQLLQWRPDVVITHAAVPGQSSPGQVWLNQQLQQAVRWAGQKDQWPPPLRHLALRPWKVQKLWGLLPSGRKGHVGVDPFQLSRAQGKCLHQLTRRARWLLQAQAAPVPDSWQFRLIDAQLPRQTAQAGLMQGVVLYRGGPARRILSLEQEAGASSLLAAQRYRSLRALLLRSEGKRANLLAAWDQLAQGIPPQDQALLMFEFAMAQVQQGQWNTASEALAELVRRWPQEKLTLAAAWWLVHLHLGSEPWMALSSSGQSGVWETLAQRRQEGLGALAAPPPANAIPASKRLELARRWLTWLERRAPDLAAGMALAHASLAHQEGQPDQARRLLALLAFHRPALRWTGSARARLWALQPQGSPPPGVAFCPPVQEKPFLDGRLEEPLWQQATVLDLKHPHIGSQWSTQVLLAQDEQFLYVAARCSRPHASATGQLPSGPRDASLKGQDRLEWFVDLEGDGFTYFHFGVGSQGGAFERCGSWWGWNPQWFVAVRATPEGWNLEAALPWSLFGRQAPRPNKGWSFGVKRVVPEVGILSWRPPRGTFPCPESWGVLLFDRQSRP